MKVGDKLKVISNEVTGHVFAIGSCVELCEILNNGSIVCLGKSRYTNNYIKNILFKNQVKKMKETVTNLDVLFAAKQLCIPNNKVTTLEIKNYLRKTFPNKKCTQDFVSKTMADYSNGGSFSYTDNGTYRVYSQVLSGVITPSTSVNVQITKNQNKKIMTTKRISRKKALELMKLSKGRFFTVEFTKKDGENRVLNGQYMSGQKDNNSYVLLKESGKLKLGENPIRNVNLDTLKTIKISGETYRIRKS